MSQSTYSLVPPSPSMRSPSRTALSVPEHNTTHLGFNALAHPGHFHSPVASPPWFDSEHGATPHALLQLPFAISTYLDLEAQNLGGCPLLAAKHAEGALQEAQDPLRLVETGFAGPSGYSLQQPWSQEPLFNFLGSLPVPLQTVFGFSAVDNATQGVEALLHTVHNGAPAGNWHGPPLALGPNSAGALDSMSPIGYQSDTDFSVFKLVAGMNPDLDQSHLTSFKNQASPYNYWRYNSTSYGSISNGGNRMNDRTYLTPGIGSLAISDENTTLTGLQDPGTASILSEAAPPSFLSTSEAHLTTLFPVFLDPPSLPAPERRKKPRKRRCKCTQPGCTVTVSRPSDLDRHTSTIHHRQRLHCSFRSCTDNKGRGFSRLDKFNEHKRTQHVEGVSQESM